MDAQDKNRLTERSSLGWMASRQQAGSDNSLLCELGGTRRLSEYTALEQVPACLSLNFTGLAPVVSAFSYL